MPRYLVVAHRTLGGTHLFEHLQKLQQDDASSSFHVLVPKYHPRDIWTDGTLDVIAQRHLDEMLATTAEMNLSATGEVGHGNPVTAISETLDREGADSFAGIVMSTLPLGASKWWRSDVPGRVEKHFPSLPFTHLVADHAVSA